MHIVMIPRIQKEQLEEKLKGSKLILLSGPKRVGKMTLLDEVVSGNNWTKTQFNCDDKKVRKELETSMDTTRVTTDLLILEEAQYLSNLQVILEDVLSGAIKATTIVCCSFAPRVDEILLEVLQMEGLEVPIFAPSFYESAQHFGLPEEEKLLEERLIYGNYPEVLADLEHAELTLREIIQEALFTNLGAQDRINKEDKMMRVLQLLAFHVGDAVSYNEIAEKSGLDNETVERYIDLLVDAFILIKLPSYHTEKRYELKKSNAIYFADNGIRNALISNFNSIFLRNDMDALWKNYLISERVKWIRMNNLNKKVYFWKTHTKQQLDFLEIDANGIRAYKTDWTKKKKVKLPKAFTEAYPTARVSVLNRSTYWTFLTSKK
ncbi:MAG: putative AAA+ superfamily ATPase [Flavobacteriaceae bacterium]|jgi:predicted AAA+ superfamily ATPase